VVQKKRADHEIMITRQLIVQRVNLYESQFSLCPLRPRLGHFQRAGTDIDSHDIDRQAGLLRAPPNSEGDVTASCSNVEYADWPPQSAS
jgi:hypothetical protein